jgi:hypothetical protein
VSPLRKLAVWIGVARATLSFKRGRLAARFRRELALEREARRLRGEVARLRRENERLQTRLHLATRTLLRRD